MGVSIDRHVATLGLSFQLSTQKSSWAEETLLIQGELHKCVHTLSPLELSLTVYTEHKISTPHLLANNSMPTMNKKKPQVILES